MKATRYEYMMAVDSFLRKYEGEKNDYLEISGDTEEWMKYFTNITTGHFPKVDAHSLPWEENTFDCVALNQVLEHVKRPWDVMKEAHRVLRPGGIAIVCSPFFYQVHHYPIDLWRFTVEGLEELCGDFSTILLKEKCGSKSLMKHMLDNPKDRKSPEMRAVQYMPLEGKDKYYVKSLVIAQK